MRFSIRNKIVLGFTASVVALSCLGWLSYRTMTKLVETTERVAHTHEVIATLESGLAILTDAETAQRGYLLTGDLQFLEDSQAAQAQVGGWSKKIRQLTADNQEQQKHLDRLEPLIGERLTVLNTRIKLRQEQGLQAAATAVASRQGKMLMDQIWSSISEMKDLENGLLLERQRAAAASARISIVIITLVSILTCVIGLLAVMIISRDLRLREQAEAELDRFFSLSLDFLCIASADGYFKRVSPAVSDILGWSVKEFLSKPFMDFVHPDDHAATLREVEKQIMGGEKVLHFENRYLHKDGSWRVLSWRSIPQTNGLMYATARDVTEQKRTQEQILHLNTDLQQHAARLETANKELEAFSYSVSHDLRAPLRHIDGFVGLLEKQSREKLDERGQRYLQIIATAARQMGTLIDDLLMFSRMGRTELHQQKMDLTALVKEVIAAQTPESTGRNIEWKVSELPQVQADAPMLRQAILNLIGNAVKYTRPRNPARIEIGLERETPDEFVFYVRDNGVGFEMEYSKKLFGVFQRLHSTEDFEGTGIGLANVRRIIQRHGGGTWAEGKVDHGATFYFSLPKKGM